MLVVDDNATNREIVDAYLGPRVAVCDHVESGPAALARLDAAVRDGRPYELVILDGQMPGMDGIELARRSARALAARIARRDAHVDGRERADTGDAGPTSTAA